MHRKPQLISSAPCICLLLSLGVHAVVLYGCKRPASRPAQFNLQQGQSAVELTLLPSIARIENKSERTPPPAPPVETPPPAKPIDRPVELSRPETEPDVPPEETDPQIQQTPERSTIERDADLNKKGVATPATCIQTTHLRYPPLSRKRGEEGTVVLALTVTAEGLVINPRILQSSEFPRLDRAALRAIQTIPFSPATENGIAIRSSIEQPFVFRLENE